MYCAVSFFFFQAEDGIRDWSVTGVQTCALPILFLAASASFAAASEAFEASVDFAPSAAGAAGFAGSPILSCHLARPRKTTPPSRAHSGLRSEEHTSELQSLTNLVCRLLIEKKKKNSCYMTRIKALTKRNVPVPP